jgi:hypothetical protein
MKKYNVPNWPYETHSIIKKGEGAKFNNGLTPK